MTLERAAGLARIGNKILSAIALILMLTMLSYGGYSLWDSYMMFRGAFVSSELLKYKPSPDGTSQLSLEELAAINADTRGWITVDDTHIDYPLMQGEDDMQYVNEDVYGEFSLSGAIFLSSRNAADLSDRYLLIYGHHMDNGAMFGDVMEFLDPDYFEKHRTGRIYTMRQSRELELFACLEADAYDRRVYDVESLCADRGELLQLLAAEATQYRDIGVKETDTIVALSTCVSAATNARVLVFGRLLDAA